MKLIEIIKKHGMLLVAGLAVIGFSSFKMIEKSLANDHWFEITPTGDFGLYLGTSTSVDCQETDPLLTLCAVKLNDNQVDNPDISPQPKPEITPSMAPEKRYKEE